MVKLDRTPISVASARRIRTHIEWNVDTHMERARGPTRSATRSFISAAALLVKVIAMISPECTRRSASRYAMRRARTRVLPEPAPATPSSGELVCSTARRCAGLRSSNNLDGRGEGGLAGKSNKALIVGPRYPPGATSGRAHRRGGGRDRSHVLVSYVNGTPAWASAAPTPRR